MFCFGFWAWFSHRVNAELLTFGVHVEGQNESVDFVIDLSDISELDSQIVSFCQKNRLVDVACIDLGEQVKQRLLENYSSYFSNDFAISIPLLVHHRGIKTRKTFKYHPRDKSTQGLELAVASFCEAQGIAGIQCDLLMQAALDQMRTQSQTRDLPNTHLPRVAGAEIAERENGLRFNAKMKSEDFDYKEEKNVDRFMLETVTTSMSTLSATDAVRIVFIHSCMLSTSNVEILTELLDLVHNSGLADEAVAIFVVNFGLSIPGLQDLVSRYPSVSWIHRGDDVSRFEIPTLRHMHHLSASLRGGRGSQAQLLYLHTKGVSYTEDHPQIRDWRHLMTHFLVTKHSTCKYLLLSGEFDAIGCNYNSFPRLFSGNMWWTTASFLTQLPSIDPSESKYTGETWLLGQPESVRIYVPYNSFTDHTIDEHPPHLYSETKRYRPVSHATALYIHKDPALEW